MASKQDIITAIKNLKLFLKITQLESAQVCLNANGTPFVFAGGFNLVFKLVHNGKKWAFRIWHVPIGENKDRYIAISKYLTKCKLPYFVDFIYDENALLVNGELIDSIRMEWLEGILLKEYIEKYLHDKLRLGRLADDFLTMTKTLRRNKISHGDLQEGNILLNDTGKIMLVDYDSVCIPELEGQSDLITGLKGYQHPSRFKEGKASLKADYFPELIIYLSILSIASRPELWHKYAVKDSCYLLFTEEDFDNLEASAIYADLKNLKSIIIDQLLIVLLKYINTGSYLELNPFEEYFTQPKINYFRSDKTAVISGVEITLEWKVDEADEIEITEGIGRVKDSGSRTLHAVSARTYMLKASNAFGTVEERIHVSTFPSPVLEVLKVSMPEFKSTVNLNQMASSPHIDLSINLGILNGERPHFTKQPKGIRLANSKDSLKPKLNLSEIYESIKRKISRL